MADNPPDSKSSPTPPPALSGTTPLPKAPTRQLPAVPRVAGKVVVTLASVAKPPPAGTQSLQPLPTPKIASPALNPPPFRPPPFTSGLPPVPPPVPAKATARISQAPGVKEIPILTPRGKSVPDPKPLPVPKTTPPKITPSAASQTLMSPPPLPPKQVAPARPQTPEPPRASATTFVKLPPKTSNPTFATLSGKPAVATPAATAPPLTPVAKATSVPKAPPPLPPKSVTASAPKLSPPLPAGKSQALSRKTQAISRKTGIIPPIKLNETGATPADSIFAPADTSKPTARPSGWKSLEPGELPRPEGGLVNLDVFERSQRLEPKGPTKAVPITPIPKIVPTPAQAKEQSSAPTPTPTPEAKSPDVKPPQGSLVAPALRPPTQRLNVPLKPPTQAVTPVSPPVPVKPATPPPLPAQAKPSAPPLVASALRPPSQKIIPYSTPTATPVPKAEVTPLLAKPKEAVPAPTPAPTPSPVVIQAKAPEPALPVAPPMTAKAPEAPSEKLRQPVKIETPPHEVAKAPPMMEKAPEPAAEKLRQPHLPSEAPKTEAKAEAPPQPQPPAAVKPAKPETAPEKSLMSRTTSLAKSATDWLKKTSLLTPVTPKPLPPPVFGEAKTEPKPALKAPVLPKRVAAKEADTVALPPVAPAALVTPEKPAAPAPSPAATPVATAKSAAPAAPPSLPATMKESPRQPEALIVTPPSAKAPENKAPEKQPAPEAKEKAKPAVQDKPADKPAPVDKEKTVAKETPPVKTAKPPPLPVTPVADKAKAPEAKAPETKPVEVKAPESKPADKPVADKAKAPEAKAPETKPVEVKAPEVKPADKPIADKAKPPEPKAPDIKPPENKALEAKPSETKPPEKPTAKIEEKPAATTQPKLETPTAKWAAPLVPLAAAVTAAGIGAESKKTVLPSSSAKDKSSTKEVPILSPRARTQETKPAAKATKTAPPKAPKPEKKTIPLTRAERAKRRRLMETVFFWAVCFPLALAGLALAALHFGRDTRVEGQIIPPQGMSLSNEVWIVSDFSSYASGISEDLAEERAPIEQEMQERQEHVQRAQADVAAREERIRLIQQEIDASKAEIASTVKGSRDATQALWDGEGAAIDNEYDQKMADLKKAISDRAASLNLKYAPDQTFQSPEVWANSYRLALYEAPKGVDTAKEHQWLDDQMKAWRALTKSLDDRKEKLREQAAQIKTAPGPRIADLNTKIEELQGRIDSTIAEEEPLKAELQQAQADLVMAQAADANLDDKYYKELYALPEPSIVNHIRIPVKDNGRFTWVDDNSYAEGEPEHHYWIFSRAYRPDGRQYWALHEFRIAKNQTVELIFEPGGFISTKAILRPNLSPDEQEE